MTTTKMTKRDYFNILRAAYPETADNYDAVIAFIDHELELLARKNSTERKPSTKQVENDGLRAKMLAEMEENRLYSISEMIKEFSCFQDDPNMNSQKLSGLLRMMYDKDFPQNPEYPIERLYEKRKALFRLNPARLR